MHRLTLVFLLASVASAQENWPQFLGAGGTANAKNAKTLSFDKGKDLLYRAAIPAGASSPCIWGQTVYLTGIEGKELVMFALDRATGKERWRHAVTAPKKQEYQHKDGGVAMPTACTNGKRVFFYFPEYGLQARGLDGELAWEKKLPEPRSQFGIGSSPALCGDNVILVRDGCPDARIYAWNEKTGQKVWSVARVRMYETHTTPFVWKNKERTELIIASTGTVMSFDPETGDQMWRVEGLTPLVCTTPTANEEMLYFAGWSTPSAAPIDRFLDGLEEPMELTDEERTSAAALFNRLDKNADKKLSFEEMPLGRGRDAFKFFDRDKNNAVTRREWDPMMKMPQMGKNVMIAIKPGGDGNITKSHVAWTVKRGIPYVSSPLLYGDKVILVKAGGVIGGFDAKTGKQVIRRKRLSDHSEYYATPLGVDDRVIACSAAGTLFVLDPNDKLKTVHKVEFGEPIFASPAVVDGVVYVRTRSALYAFGK